MQTTETASGFLKGMKKYPQLFLLKRLITVLFSSFVAKGCDDFPQKSALFAPAGGRR